MSDGERNENARQGGDLPSDEVRAPNRRGRNDLAADENEAQVGHGRQENALLEVRTYFEERFNQLLLSNRRTQRLQETASRTPLKSPGNEKQVNFNQSILNVLQDVKDLVQEDRPR